VTARIRRIGWIATAALVALSARPVLAGPSCSGVNLIDQTLANGARWQFCWAHHNEAGIVLSDVFFSAPSVAEQMILGEVSLAQIHVPYDDDGARFHDITDYGAGGTRLNDLAAADCPGGTRLKLSGKNMVCWTIKPRGAAYDKIGAQQQGTQLEVFSVSHIGNYNYIPVYRFADDGSIEFRMGATGSLQRYSSNPAESVHGWPLGPAATPIGLSHVHNYFYRLDFDLGATTGDDIFERIDTTADGTAATRAKTITAYTNEGSDVIAPNSLREWRVRDASITNAAGHPISYELVPLESGHRDVGPAFEPFTHDDIFVTKYKNDERYASHNDGPIPSAPNENLTEFYAPAESIAGGADLVVWYGLTFHHIPRDEDEDKMDAHWNGFRIEPRDWSSLPEPGSIASLGAGIALLAALRRRTAARAR
jgi:Cu2+-containing amine oxidase